MRVTTVRPNLTQLTRLCFVNAYLVPEDDGLTLVDTMIGGSGNAILAAAGGLHHTVEADELADDDSHAGWTMPQIQSHRVHHLSSTNAAKAR